MKFKQYKKPLVESVQLGTWTGGGKYKLYVGADADDWGSDCPVERRFDGFDIWSPEEAQKWAINAIQEDYPDNMLDDELPIKYAWVEVFRDMDDGDYYSVQFITGNISAHHYNNYVGNSAFIASDPEEYGEYWDLHSKDEQLPEGWWLNSSSVALDEAIADYRNFANLEEGVEVTADNLDEWALNEASVKHNIQSYDLKRTLLHEDKTIDQAARELEADKAKAESQNQVDKVLDRSLKIARRKQRSGDHGDFPNVLLISDAGFGKTDMVRQWADKNGINLVQKNLGTMGPEAFGGIIARDSDDPRYATRLGTNEMIKALEKPNSVLFLDEYNRSKTEVRGAVLTLVQNHMVWDPTVENQERYLENFLFTIAAINPPNAAYKGAKEMDPAEVSRFYSMNMQPDPMEHLKYLKSHYAKKLEEAEDDEERLEIQGRLALAEAILTSPEFTYDNSQEVEDTQDDPSYKPLNYRSFKLALDYSDGTKAHFLSVWNHYCNYKKKKTIEGILGNYVDVQDKATDAIKEPSTSSVFAKTMSNREKLKKAFDDLNI